MRMQKTLIALTAAATLAGCTMTNEQKVAAGAIGGALAGGVIGHQVHHERGRYVGAVLGALAGGAITNYMNQQQQVLENSQELSNSGIDVARVDNATIKLNLPAAITFAVDKSTLNAGVQASLNEITAVINQYPKTAIHVLGFTDSDGSDSYNMALSQRRAQSVKNYLVSRGVVANRIVATGYGENYPIASNNSPAGKAQNRRAEIYIKAIEQGNEQAAYYPIL